MCMIQNITKNVVNIYMCLLQFKLSVYKNGTKLYNCIIEIYYNKNILPLLNLVDILQLKHLL